MATIRPPRPVHIRGADNQLGCPVCARETILIYEKETSVIQMLSSAFLCLICFPCVFPCAMPYCFSACYDKKSICSECGVAVCRERAVEVDH